MSLNEVIAAWETAFSAGTRADRTDRALRLAPYFEYIALRGPEIPDYISAAVRDLAGEYSLGEGSTVLDVGCGTGGAALAFARLGCDVTAIDICPESLNYARRQAESGGLSARFIHSLWEDYTPSGRYNLCFSSLCTGICDYRELLRFEGMSRGHCALITVGSAAGSHLRSQLRKAVDPNPLPGMIARGDLLLSLLGEMGRKPLLFEYRIPSILRLTAEEAIGRYSLYFKCHGYTRPETVQTIRDFITEHSQHGIWTEDGEIQYMLVHWTPPQGAV